MNSNRSLGSFESMLLLSILRLADQAHGLAIRHELIATAKKNVAIGAIYTGLERLERKGFVKSWLGEPTPARGGRAKRFYRVTAKGIKILTETQSAIQKLTAGLNLAGGNAHV